MEGTAQVEILVNTDFEGTALVAQIESIFRQSVVDWRLWIRENGNPLAVAWAASAAASDHRVHVVRDEMGKLSRKDNLVRLLGAAFDSGGLFFALSSVDNIWLPKKLEQQLKSLRPLDGPALVTCDFSTGGRHTYLTSAHLLDANRSPSLRCQLSQNCLIENGLVFNRELALLAMPVSPFARNFDWWIGLVCAAAGGRFAFVEESLLESPPLGHPDRWPIRTFANVKSYHRENIFFRVRSSLMQGFLLHLQRKGKPKLAAGALDEVQGFLRTLRTTRWRGAWHFLTGRYPFQKCRMRLLATFLFLTKRN